MPGAPSEIRDPPHLAPRLRLSYRGTGASVVLDERGPWFSRPRPSTHPDTIEVCLVERGVEQVWIGGREFRCEAGQIGFIPPGVEHTASTGSVGVRELSVHLGAQALEPTFADLGLRVDARSAVVAPMPLGPELARLCGMLKREVAFGAPGQELAVTSLVTVVTVAVVRRVAHRAHAAPCDASSRLQRAEERLRASVADAPNLAELAADVGLSPYHFLRAFKKRFGLPPHAYLVRLRLERAATLLETTETPLTAIAHDVGFASGSRFAAAFRRAFGVTPTDYRAARGSN